MSHQVALAFEDGVTRFISCAEDQTVADASYRARINIPLDCRDGACGTCKAFCESGDFDEGTYIDDALTDDEAAAGYVLPCSMKPKSDLVLQIASTSAVAKTEAATFSGTLTGLDRLSPTTVALTVETPDRDGLAFLPGQYVNITVPGTDQTRSYSFSNAPDDERLTFLVKLSPGGVMTEYLTRRASVGDELTFTGPHGSFFLREADRPVLLLAGGTGLAPILSILRKLRADESRRPVHMVYGVSSDDDLVELETIEGLADEIDGLTWSHCVADPGSSATNKGYVTDLVGPEHLYDGDVAVYLCGPPPMVEAVRKHFAEIGVMPRGLYYEKFAPSGTAVDAEASADSATWAGSGSPEAPAASVAPANPAAPEAPAIPAAPAGHSPAEPEELPAPEPTPTLATDIGVEGRAIAGQVILPPRDITPLHASAAGPTAEEQVAVARAVAGQRLTRPWSDAPPTRMDRGHRLVEAPEARAVAGQVMLPQRETIEAGHRTRAQRGRTGHAARPATTVLGGMDEAKPRRRPAFVTPGRFDGKVVVVTGAAQGIGECTARRISAEGGTLVLADRSDLVHELAEELAADGCEALPVTADLETWEGNEEVVSSAVARFGRVDVAVHTVGGTIWAKPFEHYPPEQIQAEINRSLFPTLWGCRAVLPSMVARGQGTIVNVSSVATRGMHRIPYAAAKGGVNAITSALAMEAAPHGVRVAATAPGGTEAPPRRIPRGPSPETEQEKEWYQAIVEQTVESSLMKRYGSLDEQAAAIVFLASDEASYITGTVLPVAGGDLG